VDRDVFSIADSEMTKAGREKKTVISWNLPLEKTGLPLSLRVGLRLRTPSRTCATFPSLMRVM
jgi:hypothetical protein